MIKPFRYLLLCAVLDMNVVSAARAQEVAVADLPPAPAPQASSSGQATPPPAQQPSSDDEFKAAKKQRLLGIMPAFNTVPGGVAKPLKPSQKFDLWFRSAVDPFTFAVAGLDAGIEQANNTHPDYHQGFEGYAKRFGAAYADNVDGNFWGNAVLPSLLHQDPRYFRLGHGSAKRRLGYALLSTVRCKGDNGKWQPSYSNIAGNLIGGAISNAYYPASDRGVGQTFESAFTVTAEGAFGSMAFEFYPDAIAYLKRRHDRKAGIAAPPLGTPAAPAQP